MTNKNKNKRGPKRLVHSVISVDSSGSAGTRLWTRISTNLSALKSRRTLPKVNGRSVLCLNPSAASPVRAITIGRRAFCAALLFSPLNSCQTQTGFSSLYLCPCSKHLMPQRWCATCGSCSWVLVSRDLVKLLPPVPATDICSQRKRRRRRKTTWEMGRRRAVSQQ